MKALLAGLLLLVAAPTLAPGADPADPRPENLVGTWRSRTSRSEGTVTIHRDGTFQYRPDAEPRTVTGLWRLEGRAIVWSYSPAPGLRLDPRAQPDVNAVVELSISPMVFRMSGGRIVGALPSPPRSAT